jgi:FemAB-related protein (PEP-CTERM system-associated)
MPNHLHLSHPPTAASSPAEERGPILVEVLAQVSAPVMEQHFQSLRAQYDAQSCVYDPVWLGIVCRGLRHDPYLLVAREGERTVGILPLALVKSLLFGRFLVSLPYVNTAGVIAQSNEAAAALVDRAVGLADELKVRHLELRQEVELQHPDLGDRITSKVHMRLALPDTVEGLERQIRSKVRNKIRKGERQGFTAHWGQLELLEDFYEVFSRNMRDLGTPVFSRKLFREILVGFSGAAELCVIRSGQRPVAAGLLVHGNGVTLVPSASSLRSYNSTNVNDWMYWQLLQRAVSRGQAVFDFGRSSRDGNTFVFKKKWGAEPEPAVWQYYVREGSVSDMRPENGKYARAVRMWQKLPVPLTRLIGPSIVRGIP